MTSPDRPASYIPYLKRRNTPAQLHALHEMFDATPHPTRAQRQALANEINMELKSVTNWFQNRRQTSRKKSLSFNENNPTKTHGSRNPVRRRSKTPLDRSKISLDRIAALSERPSLTSRLNSPRLPLTPRKTNAQQKNSSGPSELWMHMLSSPAISLSSPDHEEARFAVLSSRAKMDCPLEWACLKARHKKWVDEDAGGTEVNEDGNPEPRASLTPHGDPKSLNGENALFSRQFEDVEAAITLLGFKARS